MDRRLAGPWSRIQERRDRMLARVGALPEARRERRPTPTSWSLLDVVEHCVLVEEGITTALAKEPSPDRPRRLGEGRKYPWWFVRLVLIADVRIKAPVEAILPRRESTFAELTARWERQRLALGAWLESQPDAVLAAPRFRHPLAGWLNVPAAITFIADHLGHHLSQLRRIEAQLLRWGFASDRQVTFCCRRVGR